MESVLYYVKKVIPPSLFALLQGPYHYALAWLGAVKYGFPSRNINVVGVTGTKGKSSTAELINAILEEEGYKTALAGTIRFKIGDDSSPNLYKMTMPGRFFMQKFLSDAVRAGCEWAVVEMTSEGTKQFRHKFIDLNALVFTNLSPEHIESHGSFSNYLAAKLRLRDALERSSKRNKIMIANADDKYGELFLDVRHATPLPYSIRDIEPYKAREDGSAFMLDGAAINSRLVGIFNIYNMLAAITFAKAERIDNPVIKRALEKFEMIAGRVEKVEAGQEFTVIVDYAHTPDSLQKLYEAFGKRRKICVLGNTGGGRDTWKRPEMGRIADTLCHEIILTNEDPYDEDPLSIVEAMAEGIKKRSPHIIMDRREAIRKALMLAKSRDVVLITGKGTDPYIMGPRGTKLPWSDKKVATEEIKKYLEEKAKREETITLKIKNHHP